MTLDTQHDSSSSPQQIAAARQTENVAFLHRVPFALDAYKMGFLTGFREDCSYQQTKFNSLDMPVGMLDNDFRDPDLERYISRFFKHEPQVGVIGDVYEVENVGRYVSAAREIRASYPEANVVIVPKSRAVIGKIPDDIVIGYSRGYADKLASDFSEPADWRGRRVHVLGGSPPKQWQVIQELTRPTVTGKPPADIVSLDWNGLHRGAQFGEFWTADGWDDSGRDAGHVTVRKTVRHSLGQLKSFWKSKGVWPESSPIDTAGFRYESPRPSDLENAACERCQENVWKTSHGPYVAEYDTGAICGYCSYGCYFTHRSENQLEEIVGGKQSVYIPTDA